MVNSLSNTFILKWLQGKFRVDIAKAATSLINSLSKKVSYEIWIREGKENG